MKIDMSAREYLCLNDWYTWHTRVAAIPRQCPRCWSYDLIEKQIYDDMVATTVAMNGNPSPAIDALIAVVQAQGLTWRPARTLSLVLHILADVERLRKAQGGASA